MDQPRLKPVTDREDWIEVDALEFLRLPAIKSHLIRNCGFRDIDWKRLFQLFERDKRRLCRAYGVESIPIAWFATQTEERNATILLEVLSQATKVGPRTEQVIKNLRILDGEDLSEL